ncbi:MAG: hypothetical protein DDT19_02743 [Syntrophomonadaceae bacterium]|nr:hypothetical protein [Bacillota bacterium]
MKINIMTDSLKPNLAAMKISAFHKAMGDEVFLNFPLIKADFTYASILFSWTEDPHADLIGGPKYPPFKLDPEIESMKPDYDLYPHIDYSLGYTYKACPRTCDFCIVPKQKNDEKHYSIWDFHDPKFKKICLLNNNTLADLNWRETFQEIIDANLIYIDENGIDLRLLTEEMADYIVKLRIDNMLHCAWDFIEHEQEVLKGITLLKKAGFRMNKLMPYVLIGHSTTNEEDLYRVTKIRELGANPFVMPKNKHDDYQRRFARWVNHKAIFKTVKWEDYR